jgi:hypothetical protein
MEQLDEATIDLDRLAAALPALLTVEESARVLRISRSLAYELAQQYEASGGVTGLPVIRVGTCLRVPRWALIELIRTGRVVNLRPRRPNIRAVQP